MTNWIEQLYKEFPFRSIAFGEGRVVKEILASDNEIIDFIEKLLDKQRKEIIEKLIADIPDKYERSLEQYDDSDFKQQLKERWLK